MHPYKACAPVYILHVCSDTLDYLPQKQYPWRESIKMTLLVEVQYVSA